jgi:hypothetical protein
MSASAARSARTGRADVAPRRLPNRAGRFGLEPSLRDIVRTICGRNHAALDSRMRDVPPEDLRARATHYAGERDRGDSRSAMTSIGVVEVVRRRRRAFVSLSAARGADARGSLGPRSARRRRTRASAGRGSSMT